VPRVFFPDVASLPLSRSQRAPRHNPSSPRSLSSFPAIPAPRPALVPPGLWSGPCFWVCSPCVAASSSYATAPAATGAPTLCPSSDPPEATTTSDSHIVSLCAVSSQPYAQGLILSVVWLLSHARHSPYPNLASPQCRHAPVPGVTPPCSPDWGAGWPTLHFFLLCLARRPSLRS
jgi:hypothetical protein